MSEKLPLNLESLTEIKPTLTQIDKLRIYDYGNGTYLLTGFHEDNKLDTTPKAHDIARFVAYLASKGIGVVFTQVLEIWAQSEKTAVLINTNSKTQSPD